MSAGYWLQPPCEPRPGPGSVTTLFTRGNNRRQLAPTCCSAAVLHAAAAVSGNYHQHRDTPKHIQPVPPSRILYFWFLAN